MSSRRIAVFDTTLRDGEQSPGIALRPHEKAEIAAQLERLGVDVIEAGFAAVLAGDFEGVRAVARRCGTPPSRRCARTAARTSTPPPRRSPTRRGRGSTSSSRRARSTWRRSSASTPDEVVDAGAAWSSPTPAAASTRSSSRARTRPAPTPRSSPESAPRGGRRGRRRRSTSRTPSAIRSAGRVRASSSARSCATARSSRASSLSAHCHDDLGLAVANTLAGIRAGATQVECTVNGIGERAGNAALEEVVMALRVRADAFGVVTGVDPAEIGADVAARRAAHRLRRSRRTRRSSARTRSRTRPASTRTAC